jgi:hypothetical protein
MFSEPGLMRSLIEAGASGYILKDDQTAFKELGNIVLSIARYLLMRIEQKSA